MMDKENDSITNENSQTDFAQHTEKSAWQVAKELKNQAAAAEEKREAQRIEAQRKEREEYEKQLRLEKIEILRKKQGISSESDQAEPEHEKPKLSIGKRISTFFYHNKWWLGFGALAAALVGFIIYDTVTQEKYDMYIMLLSCENDIYYYQSNIISLFEDNCEDLNGDGEVNVALLYYSPSSYAATNDIYHSNEGSMAAQFRMGDTIVVIADPSLDEVIYPQETLADLEKYYDDENISGYGYYVDGTAFSELCGVENPTVEGMYIGLRSVIPNTKYTDIMQKNFDAAVNTLGGVIEDINAADKSGPQLAE